MIAFRRSTWNFALQRAAEWARKLGRPLVILEALRCGYPWASDRLHRFILDGMASNARQLGGTGVLYYPYVEPSHGAGKGLLAALARRACVVVTDDFPCFFIPRMLTAAARKVPVHMEKADSNGLLPLREAERSYPTAYAFRRFLQKNLRPYLSDFPAADPLCVEKRGRKADERLPRLEALPPEITRRWPAASPELLAGDLEPLGGKPQPFKGGPKSIAQFPIDHTVGSVKTRGGADAARSALIRFLDERLERYAGERNQPEKEVTSGLSPYLHFGHISVHEVVSELMQREGWTRERLATKATGGRKGWWGMGEAAEAFLDQLVTWRELGFNMCAMREDYDRYESLPDWARKTLADHEGDPRPYLYTPEVLEAARTHDPLWNAAQTQLVREGRIHNYLRMLWGKKILEWSPTPRDAIEVMIELNNKYTLDGRDPNSYSGIFWTLGRYDRAWGPERPIFGKIRYMSSKNTARKVRVKRYIQRYAPQRNPVSERHSGP
jgi:deoxyribodipyrimidine photo-lyase